MHLSAEARRAPHLRRPWPSLARSAPETGLPLGTPAGTFLQLPAPRDPLGEGGKPGTLCPDSPTPWREGQARGDVAGACFASFLGFLSLFAWGSRPR